MHRALLAALVTAALAAALTLAASAPAKTRSCAAVGYYGISYPVRIERGTVSCKTARLTLRRFLVNGASPKGWRCFRGHLAGRESLPSDRRRKGRGVFRSQ